MAKKSHASTLAQFTQTLSKSASTQLLSFTTTQPVEDLIVIEIAHVGTDEQSVSDDKKVVSPEEKLSQSFCAYVNNQLIDLIITAKLKSTWHSPVYTFFKTNKGVVQ